MTDQPQTRWQQLAGRPSGSSYDERFARLAASGHDVHGEATFCHALLDRLIGGPGRVLDAGCGTGRVAVRLAALGHTCTGLDVDESMLAVARTAGPALTWVAGDLAALPEEVAGPFELVVLAGNVVPLLAEGTLAGTVRGLAATLAPGGRLVAGFGLDARHLPRGCPVTPLSAYDDAAVAAGLVPEERFATWDRAAYDDVAGYAVCVHRPA